MDKEIKEKNKRRVLAYMRRWSTDGSVSGKNHRFAASTVKDDPWMLNLGGNILIRRKVFI